MAKLFWKKANPPPWLEKLGWRIEAGMLGALWLVVKPMSPIKAANTGRLFMGWLGPRLNKHKHVKANLRIACPEKTPQEIEQLAISSWGNVGAVLAELAHTDKLTDRQVKEPAIEVVNQNNDAAFVTHSKPCIFIAAHLGNWEMSGFAIEVFGYPVDVVYSPFANTYLEKMVQKSRAPMRCKLMPKVNALRAMYKSLKKNRSVGLHVDVRVDGGDLYPFCGVDASTTTAPAWLALKTGLDIVPITTVRLPNGKFRSTLYPAIKMPADKTASTAIDEITIEMNRVIGDLIRQHPEQWMCTKRRWPKDTMRERGVYD
jgi:KDO2-lipid IV(A) lauroyltransferase